MRVSIMVNKQTPAYPSPRTYDWINAIANKRIHTHTRTHARRFAAVFAAHSGNGTCAQPSCRKYTRLHCLHQWPACHSPLAPRHLPLATFVNCHLSPTTAALVSCTLKRLSQQHPHTVTDIIVVAVVDNILLHAVAGSL